MTYREVDSSHEVKMLGNEQMITSGFERFFTEVTKLLANLMSCNKRETYFDSRNLGGYIFRFSFFVCILTLQG